MCAACIRTDRLRKDIHNGTVFVCFRCFFCFVALRCLFRIGLEFFCCVFILFCSVLTRVLCFLLRTNKQEGPSTDRGLSYRTLDRLFAIAGERSETCSIDISISMLEIYNEQILDLLAGARAGDEKRPKCELRFFCLFGCSLYVCFLMLLYLLMFECFYYSVFVCCC